MEIILKVQNKFKYFQSLCSQNIEAIDRTPEELVIDCVLFVSHACDFLRVVARDTSYKTMVTQYTAAASKMQEFICNFKLYNLCLDSEKLLNFFIITEFSCC